jgi:hypothetical protein
VTVEQGRAAREPSAGVNGDAGVRMAIRDTRGCGGDKGEIEKEK